MSTIIYTAIFGEKDWLWEPLASSIDARLVCFTDVPVYSDRWDVIEVSESFSQNPRLAAKIYKILPHFYLDCEQSIWIDGNIQLAKDPTFLFNRMKHDLAFFRHPYERQTCIYREAKECIRAGKDDVKTIRKAVERYREWAHPPGWGLPQGRFILRRHTKAVEQFNETWWREIVAGTSRDQISLPPVLRRLEIPYHEFDPVELFGGRLLDSIRRRHVRPLAILCPHAW